MSGRQDKDSLDQVAGRFEAVTYFAISLLMVVLLFRFVISWSGLGAASGFGMFIYELSAPFVAPFFALLGSEPDRLAGVLEVETFLAALVYLALGYLLLQSTETRRRRPA